MLVAAGTGLTAAMVDGPSGGVAVGMAVVGVGYAGIQSPMLAAATRAVPDALMGTANGLFMMGVLLGASVGALVGVSVLPWLGEGGPAYSSALILLGVAVLPGLLWVGRLEG